MRFFEYMLLASAITIPRGKSSNALESIASKSLSPVIDSIGNLDPSLLVFEFLGKHLSFQDLANLNSVSKTFNKVTRPLIDIARLCDPESTYPRLVLKSSILSRDCVQALINVFRNHRSIRFEHVEAADWRILELGIPLNDLTLDQDFIMRLDDNMDGFWNALQDYRGSLSLQRFSLARVPDSFVSSFLSSANEISGLKLSVHRILESQAKMIGSYFKESPRISWISLEGLSMSRKSWQYLLGSISEMTSLKSLKYKDLSKAAKTQEHIVGLAGILSSVRTLEDFTFLQYFTNDYDVKILVKEGLSHASNLKRLEWDSSLIGEFDGFGEALKSMNNLEELTLAYGYHSSIPEYQSFLNSLAEIQSLKRLTLEGTFVGFNDKVYISSLTSSLANLKNLQELNLIDIDLMISGKTFFSSFVKPASLKHLSLDFLCPNEEFLLPQDLKVAMVNMIIDCQMGEGLESLVFNWDRAALPLSFAKDIVYVVGLGGRKDKQTIKHLDLGEIVFGSDLLSMKAFVQSISSCMALETLKMRFSDGWWDSLYTSFVAMLSKHVPESLKTLKINDHLYVRDRTGNLKLKSTSTK